MTYLSKNMNESGQASIGERVFCTVHVSFATSLISPLVNFTVTLPVMNKIYMYTHTFLIYIQIHVNVQKYLQIYEINMWV